MSVECVRRFYLLKRLEAARLGEESLESVWMSKQLAEAGTALAATFPSVTTLASAGYVAVEDVDGATVEELQLAGLSTREADAVLAAL